MKSTKLLPVLAGFSLAVATLILAPGCASTPTSASTGQHIDDSVITTKVKTALVRNDSTPGGAIKVETFKGAVQLAGFVDTEAQKTDAAAVAAKTEGVKTVINEIVVASSLTKSTAGEYLDDSVITAKVKAAFLKDKGTPAAAIGVDTLKGTVQLSGFVDSAEQKAQAGVVAGAVAGVKAVLNNIAVK